MVAASHFAETLDRARGAVMLMHDAPTAKDSWRAEAYIRGGLAEFGAMRDALSRDLKRVGRPDKAYTPKDSRKPLIHLLSAMRDIEIHTAPSKARSAKTSVTIQRPDGSPFEFELDIVLLIDLTTDRLVAKREVAKAYERAQLDATVSWFNSQQDVFGASHLLGLGVAAYCSEILTAHRPQPNNVEARVGRARHESMEHSCLVGGGGPRSWSRLHLLWA